MGDGQPDGSGECGVWYTRDPPEDWAQADRWDDWGCAESLSFVCQSDCYDVVPDHCPRWAANGECEATGYNPDYMHLNCRLSCGLCGVQKRGNKGEGMKPRRRPKKPRRPPPERRPMAQRPKIDGNDSMNERNIKKIKRLLDVLTKHKKTE